MRALVVVSLLMAVMTACGDPPSRCDSDCVVQSSYFEKTCDEECMAPRQCDAIVETLCEALSSSCDDLTFNECKNEATIAMPCEDAVGVSSSYDECIDDAERLECADETPASCQGVVLVPEGWEPTQCGPNYGQCSEGECEQLATGTHDCVDETRVVNEPCSSSFPCSAPDVLVCVQEQSGAAFCRVRCTPGGNSTCPPDTTCYELTSGEGACT